MTMNPLPPQAYTKDTMLRAYQWLMGQNSSIKEMATTPDILVSLYLKATRDGDHALDRPSIQNFKNELRSLAGLMGELDKKSPPVGAPPSTRASVQTAPAPTAASTTLSRTEATLPKSSNQLLELLDEGTLQMIREVKCDFNLSHETEALRMLIKIGYIRTKAFLT